MYSVRQILKDNWRSYLRNNKVKDYQKKEVEKTINCNKFGCNSRICSSCGKRYTDQWSDRLSSYLFPVPHKHVLLTVPSLLRPILRNWNNIRILMNSSMDF
jgi:hypothetical protein